MFMLTCTFAGFCGLSGCPEGPENHAVKARLDPDSLIAEFWTSAEPGVEPWPAIVQETGISVETWGLFSAGAIHGHWMLSVVPSTGDALLTHHRFFMGTDARSASGRCQITQEAI